MDLGVYGARGIPSTYSGYETFLTAMLPELVARGHTVTMYCRRGESPTRPAEFRGVRLRYLPAARGKQWSTLSHGGVAALAARRARHDAVLVVNVANAVFCGVNWATRQPVLLNTDGQEWERGKWGTVARAVFRRSASSAGRLTTGLVSDCRAMREVYVREFEADASVIPYAFDATSVTQDPALLQRFGVTENGFALTGGRLVPENNVANIAAAYIRSDHPLPLLVMGQANYHSPEEARLRSMALSDDRVRPVGHVHSRSEFAALLRHARVYMHGHSVGGINPSLVEAMGVGANILALDTPFNREALDDSGSFFRADFSDFALMLRRALGPECDPSRELAQDRAERLFRLSDITTAYESCLMRAIDAGPWARQLVVDTAWS